MRLVWLLPLVLAGVLHAQELNVEVQAVAEGKATPGTEYTLKLRFTVPDGFHAYHKDNPGYGLAPSVNWGELSGLELVKETWPEPHKKFYEDLDTTEWEYSGTFEIAYTFNVPADGKVTFKVAGSHVTQFCNEEGCLLGKGDFSAEIDNVVRQDSHGFYVDFDYALEQAKKADKPLLVDFNGRNCPPCRTMEAKVFTLPEVKKLFEGFVIASVQNDISDARYDELWEKYKPSPGAPVPYYAVLNQDGSLVRSIGSTLPAEKRAHEFVAFLKGELIPAEKAAVGPSAWPEGLYDPPTDQTKIGFDFEAKFSADKIKPGGTVTLELHFKMKASEEGGPYHLYHPDTKFGIPLILELKGAEGVEAAGAWTYPKPHIVFEEGVGEQHYLEGEVIVVHEFKVPADAKPGSIRVYGTASGQFCDLNGCIQFNRADASMPDRMFGWVATAAVSPEGVAEAKAEASSGGEDAVNVLDKEIEKQGGLFLFLFFALLGGMVTLLTPCVLPVIPLTIGFFVGQAEKGKSPLLTAFIYCTCIVASFTIFGVITSLAIGASGAQDIATNGYVNTFLALLFLVFALSFLGLFELRVPTFLTAWFSKKQMNAQKEGHGYSKAFFSGSAFSLISFSCTVPIAGVFLAGAAGGDVWMPTLAMLAFSTGMALPIFIMGQFPALMKKLPRSGGWMNALKVVFGFVEIGLAIMYFSAAEQAFGNMAAAEIVNRYVVLAVWIAASFATGLYLFGVFRMPHDHEKTEQIGVIRAVLGIAFISFALYLLPGLFGARLGNTLEGILPVAPEEGGIQLSLGGGERNDYEKLPKVKVLEQGLQLSAQMGKPVFIDFTGYN